MYQEELMDPANANANSEEQQKIPLRQFAVLELEKPVTCSSTSLVIGSKLDTDIHSNVCRLAFHGVMLEAISDVKYQETILPQVKVYKDKQKEGVVERKTDEYFVVCKGLFKKETNMETFVGLKVKLSTGEDGVIEGGFGQSGKFKVRIPSEWHLPAFAYPTTILRPRGSKQSDPKWESRSWRVALVIAVSSLPPPCTAHQLHWLTCGDGSHFMINEQQHAEHAAFTLTGRTCFSQACIKETLVFFFSGIVRSCISTTWCQSEERKRQSFCQCGDNSSRGQWSDQSDVVVQALLVWSEETHDAVVISVLLSLHVLVVIDSPPPQFPEARWRWKAPLLLFGFLTSVRVVLVIVEGSFSSVRTPPPHWADHVKGSKWPLSLCANKAKLLSYCFNFDKDWKNYFGVLNSTPLKESSERINGLTTSGLSIESVAVFLEGDLKQENCSCSIPSPPGISTWNTSRGGHGGICCGWFHSRNIFSMVLITKRIKISGRIWCTGSIRIVPYRFFSAELDNKRLNLWPSKQ